MDAVNVVSTIRELRVCDIGDFKDVPADRTLVPAAQQLMCEDEIDA
jgi:hypothetical protein